MTHVSRRFGAISLAIGCGILAISWPSWRAELQSYYGPPPSLGQPSSGERSAVLVCPYRCDLRRIGRRVRISLSTDLSLVNVTDLGVVGTVAFFDGNEALIARGDLDLSPFDLDTIDVCDTISQAVQPVPDAGLTVVVLDDRLDGAFVDVANGGVYGWFREFQNRGRDALALTQCRVVPPDVNTAQTIRDLIDDALSLPTVPLIYVEGTGE